MRDRHRARISPDLCFPLEREGGRERERERTGWTERRVGEGWREKEQRKNVSAKQREFMDEQFYLRCPLVPSPRHNDPCIGQPHLPSFPASAPPPRPLQRSRLQHTSNNMPRVNYRLTLNIATTVRPLLFSPFHPISSSKRGEISVDLTISCEILPPPLIIRNFCFF